jgi:peptidoglycan/xylan/chitin deacetylase (PgdA/CDA1 family)
MPPTLKSQALDRAAAFANACFGPREGDAFGILMYHRVAEHVDGVKSPTWNARPRRLEEQLGGLLALGWQAWPLKQVLGCLARELPIPRKTFVVTFDDGYANNWLNAYPILQRLRVPATLFLATAYLDSPWPFPSDDWAAAGQPSVPSESWRPLTRAECRQLAASGLVELGAHTHTHGDFRGRPAALLTDLEQNLAVLKDEFGVHEPTFSLPYGSKSDGFASAELASAAREAGVTCCLTTEGTIVRHGDSPFDWGRFAVRNEDTAATLAGRLSGWWETVRRVGRRKRDLGF